MIILLRYFENKERMSMIDKGEDPTRFMTRSNKSGILVLAGLMIDGGIGLLIGSMLDTFFRLDETAYFSMILVFGGVGLIFGRKMASKGDKEES